MIRVVYAGDLARDLGYTGMVPAFWAWCRKWSLEPRTGPFGFDPEDVRVALRRAGRT